MIALIAAVSLLTADEIPVELPQSPDRPPLAASELKGLRENNVFSPYRTKPFDTGRSRTDSRRPEPRVEAPPVYKPLVVTGLFIDPVSGTPTVIVEDRNVERYRLLKEPRFAVAGDEVGGIKIESVTEDVVVVSRGEERKELRVGGSLPEGDRPPPPPPGTESRTGTPSAESAPAAAPAATPAPAAVPAATPSPALDDSSKNSILEALRDRNKRRRSE
jgi:hypothetical protein